MDIARHFDRFCMATSETIVDGVCRDWERLKNLENEVRRSYLKLTTNQCEWILKHIGDPAKRRFLSLIFEGTESLDDQFLPVLITAGVNEVDPSNNRLFIYPAVRHFGRQRVMRVLLDVIQAGSDFEKAGAINALYWARPGLTWKFAENNQYTLETATPESRLEYLSVLDLQQEIAVCLLDLFLTTKSVDVQRSIIPSLSLKTSSYPASRHALIEDAIAVARAHDDEYIRHRVEVQLGNESLLRALPHRTSNSNRAS
jgi:hypothetical protein